MNYYEHHIGDYIKNTAHLSMLEDGCYRRMIDAYYTREAPLPVDKKACYRLVRAATRDEKAAVDVILDEFFVLEDDGWHQARCDTEIARFKSKQPAAQEKKESDKERQKRARERRKKLFETLREDYGITMPFDATTSLLEAELSRVTKRDESQVITQPVTRDNTSTQTPDTRHQTKNPLSVASASAPTTTDPPAENPPEARAPATPTPAGSVCRRLKAIGYGDTNPHDAVLHALLEAGLTPDEIVAVGVQAQGQGKGFRWVLATAEGRRRDAAAVKPLPTAGPSGTTGSGRQQRIDDYTAQAAAARGGQDAHTERGHGQDITGEAVRIP